MKRLHLRIIIATTFGLTVAAPIRTLAVVKQHLSHAVLQPVNSQPIRANQLEAAVIRLSNRLAQTVEQSIAEADRLMDQGIQQYQTGRY